MLVAIAYVLVQVLRPAPSPTVSAALPASWKVPGAAPSLPWPPTGQSAVGAVGLGAFETSGSLQPAPIASLAKMMTALVVLHDHPLADDEGGPTITIDAADVAGYEAARAQGESTTAIALGEQLTERQALQAILVGSDDNMANVIAMWDAGSVSAFVAKMNAEARALGLRSTNYADPSGLSSSTTSTALEQLVVTSVAVQNPTIASIVQQPTATLPVAGTVANFDTLVGSDGIVGVKTGNTTAAGGCFAVAADARVDGQPATVIAVVMGQRGQSMLQAALVAGKNLADATRAGLTSAVLVKAGSAGAFVHAPWTSPVPADATTTVRVAAWPGLAVTSSFVSARPKSGVPAGTRVGTAAIRIGNEQSHVAFATRIALPSAPITWKLHHF